MAACWFGGAASLAAALLAKGRTHAAGDVLALQLGRVDALLHAASTTLLDAAARVDSGAAESADGALLALRVRATVADAAEQTLSQVGHALGPAPLAFDEIYARRSADLALYLRQHHGERDLAALGTRLIARTKNCRSQTHGLQAVSTPIAEQGPHAELGPRYRIVRRGPPIVAAISGAITTRVETVTPSARARSETTTANRQVAGTHSGGVNRTTDCSRRPPNADDSLAQTQRRASPQHNAICPW